MAQPGVRLVFPSIRLASSSRKSTALLQSYNRLPAVATPRVSPASHNAHHGQFPCHIRPLSSSTARRATIVTQNPRTDEEGQDMTIIISEKAAKRLKQITSTPQKRNTLATSTITPDSHLRVTVTSGGCHGFQYLMSLEPSSKVDPEEDTVFVADDAAGEGKAEVVMDEASLELLKGSTIDFVTELIGSQFKIVGNPRASSSCGCGTSFDIQ